MGKVKGLVKKLIKHPEKSIAAVSLAALVATTAIKDNVHFGSVTLYNPQENHYSWGFNPITKIKKDAKGNFYNIGLIGGENKIGENSQITGNMSSYSLFFGGNTVGENSQITGNMSSYSLFFGLNIVGENSQITGDISSRGIFASTPFDLSFGSDVVMGLENYKVEKKSE